MLVLVLNLSSHWFRTVQRKTSSILPHASEHNIISSEQAAFCTQHFGAYDSCSLLITEVTWYPHSSHCSESQYNAHTQPNPFLLSETTHKRNTRNLLFDVHFKLVVALERTSSAGFSVFSGLSTQLFLAPTPVTAVFGISRNEFHTSVSSHLAASK